ncbi:ABC transporter permease [Tunicatimonas pelagia]|uniref:ABC transporter permease n=1 Tax=Tunicatimonas pelagia TaxID=931531 RepID=UPI0026670DE8|nr:ABC transporter permease [Tunicatimonas pelagia]WKN40764.1 ABC transporter permease [Tunicatimonas pelagia]
MLKNYLKIAYRNLLKNKVFSLINIVGLAIGMAAFILILLYLNFELSYDSFHQNAENIYRIPREVYQEGELIDHRAANVPAVGPTLKATFPEVKDFVRLTEARESMSPYVSYRDEHMDVTSFLIEDIYFAGPSFLDVFSFNLIKGDSNQVFKALNQAVISATTATKFFGKNWQQAELGSDNDPLGKMLILHPHWQDEYPVQIVGILEDIPDNTHFKFEILLSHPQLIRGSNDNQWSYQHFYTYILTHPQTERATLQSKIEQWKQEKLALNWEKYTDQGDWMEFPLQPLKSIHLDSNLLFEYKENGQRGNIYFLTIIAILILIIAWFNYINLSTTKSFERAKEVGLRKTVGAQRKQLIWQFLLDTAILNVLAMLLVFTILQLSLPYFNNLTGADLTFALWWKGTSHADLFWGLLITLFVMSTLLAGVYPALMLSSFSPVKALKGKTINFNPATRYSLRKSLVVFQFMITIILIAGALVVQKQLVYLHNKNLGFDASQKFVINTTFFKDSIYQGKLEAFKEGISQYAAIDGVTSSSTIPGTINWDWYYGRVDKEEWNSYTIISTDYNFFDFYEIDVIAGRTFSRDYPSDQKAVVINEAAMQALGYENVEAALNEKIRDNIHPNNSYEIVGIVKNHHQTSTQHDYNPILFILDGGYFEAGKENISRISFAYRDNQFVSINIQPTSDASVEPIGNAVDHITSTWQDFFPDKPLDYFFLDNQFDRQYQSDRRFGKIFSLFTTLAICIATLGLFGLSSYTTLARTKEVGIRKALGSSVAQILYLLSKEVIRMVVIASIVAIPFAYFAIRWWLSNYAFQTNIPWWLLAMPLGIILIIVILTISYHTIKAAFVNPVNSLRYE